jgi:trigger factor
MNVTIREESPTTRVLEVSLPPEEMDRHLDRVSGDFRRRAALPGFRKGHVPRSLVEAQFGPAIQDEAVEAAVGEAYGRAVEEHQLVPVSPPRVEDVRFRRGEPLVFRVTVEVRPRLEIRDHHGLPAVRRVRAVRPEVVERAVAQLREETAVLVDLDRAAEAGDHLVVDHVRVDDSGRTLARSRVRDARLDLSDPGLLPAFREGLVGARAGESRTLLVEYPADFSNRELAGRKARFHVRVKKVQEKRLRELDDNLARDLFGLETVAELRDRVRLQLEEEERLRSRRDLEESLLDALLARNPVAVPPGLAERLTREALARSGIDPERLGEEDRTRVLLGFRRGVERRIAREWALEAVGLAEGVRVPPEEVAEEAARLGRSRSPAARELKALAPAERRQRIHDGLLERKIFDVLIAEARIQEEAVEDDPAAVDA